MLTSRMSGGAAYERTAPCPDAPIWSTRRVPSLKQVDVDNRHPDKHCPYESDRRHGPSALISSAMRSLTRLSRSLIKQPSLMACPPSPVQPARSQWEHVPP